METAVRRIDLHFALLAESRSVRNISRWLGQGVSEVNVGLSKSLSWVILSLGISGGQRKNQSMVKEPSPHRIALGKAEP